MASKEIKLSVLFFTAYAVSLIVNILFIVVIALRRRLHHGHYALMVALATVDILIGGTWTCLSGTATLIGWHIPHEVCILQSYMFIVAEMLSAFLLAAVTIERLLFMVKPSRHAVMYTFKPVTFMIMALVGFCGVVSSIHLYGSAPVAWQADQRHCGASFTESVRLLDFTFCMDHAVPYWVISLTAIIISFIKFVLARRNRSKSGEIILERNPHAPGDSYASRLATIQSKFNSVGPKNKSKKKPSLGKRIYSGWGYCEPEHWDSDVEDGMDDGAGSKEIVPQKLYLLSKPDFVLLVTSTINVIVTSLLWLPWVIVRFQWGYTPLDNPVSGGFAIFAIICMLLTPVSKFLVYAIVNSYFSSAFLKTLFCGRNILTYQDRF